MLNIAGYVWFVYHSQFERIICQLNGRFVGLAVNFRLISRIEVAATAHIVTLNADADRSAFVLHTFETEHALATKIIRNAFSALC